MESIENRDKKVREVIISQSFRTPVSKALFSVETWQLIDQGNVKRVGYARSNKIEEINN